MHRTKSTACTRPTSRPLAGLVLLVVLSTESQAADLQFSDNFLAEGAGLIDLSRFKNGNPVEPGQYRIDVFVNQTFLDRREVRFVEGSIEFVASPCIDPALTQLLGLQADYLKTPLAECLDINAIEGATVQFDSHALRLDISIPQAALDRSARGYVPPELRDDGINAAFFDYNLGTRHSDFSRSSYLSLNSGLNLGAWRLRHRAALDDTREGRWHGQTLNSFAQRDIAALDSQVLIGQTYTSGELFESIPFTGIQLASDERMLPDALRGYAPTVRGIAETNATVRIRQSGFVIYETNVPPGPFVIDDLYPTNYGGDLDVTIVEADGREQRYTVNFAAVPQALREGATRHSLTLGRLRSTLGDQAEPRFAQATFGYGLNNTLTLMGGALAAEDYSSLLAGATVNTALGAFGADVTFARSAIEDDPVSGRSLRLSYQRNIEATGTNIGLATYRYSTEGYRTLGEAVQLAELSGRRSWAKQRAQLDFTQRIGTDHSLYATAGYVEYWSGRRAQTDFQIGFQSAWGAANYSLAAMRTRNELGQQDDQLSLSISMPFGDGPRLNSSLRSSRTGTDALLGLNGTSGPLDYGVSANRDMRGQNGAAASVSWQARQAQLSANYGRFGATDSWSAGASGSIVAHAGGVHFGQTLGETFAIVEAPGATDARIGASDTLRIGSDGYGLLPHVTPYRWNDVAMDISGLSLDLEMEESSRRVAPTAGSAVLVKFATRTDQTLFLQALDNQGAPLPFGAQVRDEAGDLVGSVGQGSVIHARGLQANGRLTVDIGQGESCQLEYLMPPETDAYGARWQAVTCYRGISVEATQPGDDLALQPTQHADRRG